MTRIAFDIDVLRSFVTGVELGELSPRRRSALAGRLPAVSAQLKKLEEQVGAPILHKAGRGFGAHDAGRNCLGLCAALAHLE